MTTTTRNGDYVDIGRIHCYYEVSGSGDPLVLLHGGMCTAETFDGQTPALAEHYRVYLPERRAHGRTSDVPGPITYEIMAQDTIAFIEAVGIERAHLVGWSDGALVGLLVALWRPELVGKLVLMAQSINWGGVRPELVTFLGHTTRRWCRRSSSRPTRRSRPTVQTTSTPCSKRSCSSGT